MLLHCCLQQDILLFCRPAPPQLFAVAVHLSNQNKTALALLHVSACSVFEQGMFAPLFLCLSVTTCILQLCCTCFNTAHVSPCKGVAQASIWHTLHHLKVLHMLLYGTCFTMQRLHSMCMHGCLQQSCVIQVSCMPCSMQGFIWRHTSDRCCVARMLISAPEGISMEHNDGLFPPGASPPLTVPLTGLGLLSHALAGNTAIHQGFGKFKSASHILSSFVACCLS